MTDNWTRIKATLEVQGRMVNGHTRKVGATTCPRCHAPTLTALDGASPSPLLVVDPTPLSPVGEALALLAGRYTVGLWQAGTHYQLVMRDSYAITGAPAGTAGHDVLAQHVCNAPVLPSAPTAHRPRVPAEAFTEPPF